MSLSQNGMLTQEQKLYRKILWFENRIRFEIDFFDLLQPQRTVSEHRRYKSGVFYSEKSMRWIQYESGLELNFIKQLEQMKNVLFYFEQPVQISYRRGKRKQTYTPDFGVYLDTKEFVLVEIKDLTSMLEDKVQHKVEVLMEFCSKKGFGLLFFDGKHTFDRLLKIKNNRKLEKEIMDAIEHTILRKKQYNEIAKRCNSTHNELLKVIIKQGLTFKAFPFKLQYGVNRNGMFRSVFVEKKRYDDLVREKYIEFKNGNRSG